MQVVVLAAGKGAKPLYEVNDKTLFRRALEQAAEISRDIIVVCEADMQQSLKHRVPTGLKPLFVPVQYEQRGTAMQLLTAACALDPLQPVMVIECNVVIKPGTMVQFGAFARSAFAMGAQTSAVLCYKPAADSRRGCSFALLEQDDTWPNNVPAIVPREPISDVAVCGVHAFSSWNVALQAVFEMVILGTTVDGEFELTYVHNNITHTTALVIPTSNYACLMPLKEDFTTSTPTNVNGMMCI